MFSFAEQGFATDPCVATDHVAARHGCTTWHSDWYPSEHSMHSEFESYPSNRFRRRAAPRLHVFIRRDQIPVTRRHIASHIPDLRAFACVRTIRWTWTTTTGPVPIIRNSENKKLPRQSRCGASSGKLETGLVPPSYPLIKPSPQFSIESEQDP
jgi:hypothetical protein